MKYKSLLSLVFFVNTLATLGQNSEPTSKISGQIFGNYYYNLQRDTGINNLKNTALTGTENLHGMEVRRALLNFDHKLSNTVRARIALESDEKNFTTSLSDKSNRFAMFMRDAWVNWNFLSRNQLIIGLQPTPPFGFIESFWENRFHEKTIMDLRGLLSTREMGIALKGQNDSLGTFKYHLLLGNNSSSKPEKDKYKRIYANIEYSFFSNFGIMVYSDYLFKEKTYTPDSSKKLITNTLLSAIALGYKQKDKISAGIEGFMQIAPNSIKEINDSSKLFNKTCIGFSAYANFYFNPNFSIIGRYDYFDPNKDKAAGDIRHFLLLGLNYKVADKFILSPSVLFENYEKINNRKITNSITARLTFHYWF